MSSICFRNQHSLGSRTLHEAFPGDPKLRKLGPQEQQEVLSSGHPVVLPHGDQQLLPFYVWQCQSHHSTLEAAVVARMSSTWANQPPCLFMPFGKQVKVAAQRLMFIGNTPWARRQPPPFFKHRSGLQAQCWARHCGLLRSLSKELQTVLCGTQLGGQALQFTTLLT